MKALITGASSGIGRDMARILSKTYDEIVIVGRNEENLNNLKKELKTKVKIVVMDLSIPNNCTKLHDENPNIDFLINCAGFGDCGEFTETDLNKELKMIDTNIKALHILTKLYLIDMKKKDSGRILNIASIAGFMPGPLMSTYYATKSYVLRLSEGIKEELRRTKSNVKINVLCPGPVDTNFKKNANVDFIFNGIKSYDVAKYALNNLNRFYIVPGIIFKITHIITHIMPSKTVAKIIYKLQSRKEKI